MTIFNFILASIRYPKTPSRLILPEKLYTFIKKIQLSIKPIYYANLIVLPNYNITRKKKQIHYF